MDAFFLWSSTILETIGLVFGWALKVWFVAGALGISGLIFYLYALKKKDGDVYWWQ